jgi:hypothetical protein
MGGRATAVSRYNVFFELGVLIHPDDRIIAKGTRMEIEGEPSIETYAAEIKVPTLSRGEKVG